tara:strand:+ start:87 stop:302 length:216 start_codon:yes stop_codon:yes gene_type:complete
MRYKTKAAALKAAKRLGLSGTHSHGTGKGKIHMAGKTHAAFEKAMKKPKKKKPSKPKRGQRAGKNRKRRGY